MTLVIALYCIALIGFICYGIYWCLKDPNNETDPLVQPMSKDHERTLVLLKPKHLQDGLVEKITTAMEKCGF